MPEERRWCCCFMFCPFQIASDPRLRHVISPFIDLYSNSEPTLMSAGGHISRLGWHHFTHGLNNTAQLGSTDIMQRSSTTPAGPVHTTPSPPTPPPTSAPLAICRQRCIVRQECSSADTTCGDICGGISFGKLKHLR